ARGAQGGSNENGLAGGKGAQMIGTFSVTGGSVLKILVGQKGTDGTNTSYNRSGGGGGGSFVWVDGSNQLLIAAAGGGGKGNISGTDNIDGSTSNSGNAGYHPGGSNGS